MNREMKVSKDKTLILKNVLIFETRICNQDNMDFDKIYVLMRNYINVKGYSPIGPLVQYISPFILENGEMQSNIKLMQQVSSYINELDRTYKMESIIKIPNCFYTRYIGSEENLPLAYQKLKIVAYEEDTILLGDSYTVLIDKIDDTITADIFLPPKKY